MSDAEGDAQEYEENKTKNENFNLGNESGAAGSEDLNDVNGENGEDAASEIVQYL